jgi:hypothetical protein
LLNHDWGWVCAEDSVKVFSEGPTNQAMAATEIEEGRFGASMVLVYEGIQEWWVAGPEGRIRGGIERRFTTIEVRSDATLRGDVAYAKVVILLIGRVQWHKNLCNCTTLALSIYNSYQITVDTRAYCVVCRTKGIVALSVR